MKNFSDDFNTVLVEAYHNLLLMEETKRKYSSASFSFRDRNAISYLLAHEEGRKISEVADYLKISRPSATSLIKKLEKNGLIVRMSDPKNERNTIVKLTHKGRLFSAYQRKYRQQLAQNVSEVLTEEERTVLCKGMKRLSELFAESIRESEEIHK